MNAADTPIIDTHIHLFDPTRPQGVPWPPKENTKLYKPALPDRLRKLVDGLGVVGAIEVEASPWLEDNQWVLDIAAKDTLIVGMIGNLEPDKPDFRKNLDRFHANPLYLGIRYGNLWGRNFTVALQDPEFLRGMKELASAGLTLDSANPSPELIANLLRLTDAVPGLRIVIDHLPRMNPPEDAPARRAYEGDLARLAARKQVYVKLSGVLRPVDGRVPTELAPYKPRLDFLYTQFGEDRVVYGSDWPNSDNWATYQEGLAVVRQYFATKAPGAAEKYFWKNSLAAYRWKKRASNQPG
jgi:predicted TIM-barrel fold metal-dependent hydrolase